MKQKLAYSEMARKISQNILDDSGCIRIGWPGFDPGNKRDFFVFHHHVQTGPGN
jgi:hypothetical protein